MFYFTLYLAADKEVPPPEEKEAIYSEAEDGNPKPIPVADFAKYFKSRSSNGAIVLREEFKVMQSNLYIKHHHVKRSTAFNPFPLKAGFH